MYFKILFPYALIFFGSSTAIFSAILGFGGVEFIIDEIFKLALRLVPDSHTYNVWVDVPIPIYYKFHFFNVTTSLRDISNGKKMTVREMGPYTYFMDVFKYDINETADLTLEYKMRHTYTFIPELSKGSETDLITFINLPYLAVAAIAHGISDDPLTLEFLDNMLVKRNETLLRTETVRDIIFDGISIQAYLDMLKDPIVEAAAESTGLKIPSSFADGKFGILKGQNNTHNGIWEIKTGVQNVYEFGEVVRWNNMSYLDAWNGDYCNKISGTDGMLLRPFAKKDTVFRVYTPQVCRSIHLTFKEEVWTKGVPCYRFEAMIPDFLSVDTWSDKWCFCPGNDTSVEQCTTDGLLPLGPCYEGAPLVGSLPHFLGVRGWIADSVNGLHPDPKKHISYMDVYPKASASIVASVKVQLNIELTPWDDMPSFVNVSKAVVPFVWAEQYGELDDFHRYAFVAVAYTLIFWDYGKYVFILFGFFQVSLGFMLKIIWSKRKRDE